MPLVSEVRRGVPAFPRSFPTHPHALMRLGVGRAEAFCRLNGLEVPAFRLIRKVDWYFDACAFYRPDESGNRYLYSSLSDSALSAKGYGVGINICLEHCGRPCPVAYSRNWTWPGSTTDREPYGVILHELGHHVDWTVGDAKGRYWSNYGTGMAAEADEPAISGYAPNPAEWFAEMFRLFLSNPDLLRILRPRTFALLSKRWKPVETRDWRAAMGTNAPPRVVKANQNKMRGRR